MRNVKGTRSTPDLPKRRYPPYFPHAKLCHSKPSPWTLSLNYPSLRDTTQYLRFWVNERQDNWHAYLPLAEFAHNNWPNETTGESPFFVLYGFNLRADW